MVVPDKYLVRDVKGLPDGVHLSFNTKLKPELICCVCNAVTQNGLKDGKGHIYCQACIKVHTDESKQFTCSLCECKMHIENMSSNEKEWEILKKMKSACPNEDKTCPFEGTLQDVLRHYKTCDYQRMVTCSLCNSLQDRSTVGDHMKQSCPRRVVECAFCERDVDWCDKLKHERSCRHRPVPCLNFRRKFRTVAELENNHYSECPEVPVNCAFKELGCTFNAARHDVILHEAEVKHTEIIVQEVCRLKEENKTLRQTVQAQEAKYEASVVTLREEFNDVQKKLDEILQKQEQQFKVENSKHLHKKLAVQAFLTRMEKAVTIVKQGLHVGPVEIPCAESETSETDEGQEEEARTAHG